MQARLQRTFDNIPGNLQYIYCTLFLRLLAPHLSKATAAIATSEAIDQLRSDKVLDLLQLDVSPCNLSLNTFPNFIQLVLVVEAIRLQDIHCR